MEKQHFVLFLQDYERMSPSGIAGFAVEGLGDSHGTRKEGRTKPQQPCQPGRPDTARPARPAQHNTRTSHTIKKSAKLPLVF